MIAVIDYGMGNLRSVEKALKKVGGRVRITSKPSDIAKCDKLVLPGVGAFGDAMNELKRLRLVAPIKDAINEGKTFLGLCLGMQLLFDASEEAPGVKGLSVLGGNVKRFKFGKGGLKVPHMGWNQVTCTDAALKKTMFNGIKDNAYFYFVHSYYGIPRRKNMIAATTDYGKPFCSAVAHGRVWGCQFHPEKSSASGLRLLKNFLTEVTAC